MEHHPDIVYVYEVLLQIDDFIFHALANNELRGVKTSYGCHNTPVPLHAAARHTTRLLTCAVGRPGGCKPGLTLKE